MIQIRNILFPTDFSRCADQALMHAVFWQESFEAELHALHAITLPEDEPYHAGPDQQELNKLATKMQQIAESKLSERLQTHESLATRVIQRVISPSKEIVDYARQHAIDLIVMGTHGRSGFEHFLLGSVAEKVLRKAPCPVLTVREQDKMERIEKIASILVPLDFSEYSRKALAVAVSLTSKFKAKLQLLHVIEDFPQSELYMTVGSIFELVPDIKNQSKKALERILKETSANVTADISVIAGRASFDIVNFADKHETDLIVIATHGLTGIEHAMLGSVAEKVARHASSPVLTVKAFEQ